MAVRMAEHQKLDHEFYVDNATAIMLEIKQAAGIRVDVAHLVAHGLDFICQRAQRTRPAQDFSTNVLEAGADASVTRNEACTRKRLMLPNPCLSKLVILKCADVADQQASGPVWPQTQIGFV